MSEARSSGLMQAHIIAARGLRFSRGRQRILDDASLALRAGELAVLIGPNGAGKTTLLRAMAGLIATDGEVTLDGDNLAALPPRKRATRIAYLPQGHQFHWPLSVRDVIALGRAPFAGALTRMSEADVAIIQTTAAATGVSAFLDRSILTLSGGERARVALARALATQASVLFADEPTAALDARHQLLVMDLLRDAARAGAAVLAVIHDLTLASRFADRVIVMDRGQICADGTPENVLTATRLAETFGIDTFALAGEHGPVLVPRSPINPSR